jgi:hypothetical protein
MRALLVKDPAKRLGAATGAEEIKAHPWFENVNWALLRCAGGCGGRWRRKPSRALAWRVSCRRWWPPAPPRLVPAAAGGRCCCLLGRAAGAAVPTRPPTAGVCCRNETPPYIPKRGGRGGEGGAPGQSGGSSQVEGF